MHLPEGKTLYDLLEIEKKQVDEDENIIKKAYRRLALQYHPDKQSSKTSTAQDLENATQRFQLVGFAYTILSDPRKRKHYDLTGSLDGEDSFLSGDKDWTDFFKELWQGVVSSETIDAHSLKYKGSKEEEDDLLKYYTQLNGDMNHILAHVEHSKASDVPRFMEMINTAIQNGKVTSYPSYDKTTTKAAQLRRIKREERETAAAEKEAANKREKKSATAKNNDKGKHRLDESENNNGSDNKDDDLDSLREMMKARQEQRKGQMDAMLASMEEKATKTSPRSKSTKRTSGTSRMAQRKRKRGGDDDDDDEKDTTQRSNGST
ncbi:DnaJ domain-containing protein [Absidia repens]|uniref:DnaJ domain-containing protein n=1 Tax=Absidia repens TaxID=90262 RepID=A0A1X2HZA9_9FUNG|nr:DnaJ domain-containing protein [Absidia repens]